MKENFDVALAALLDPSREGGFSNDKQDSGGATNHGVTQRVWEAYVGHDVDVEDMKALTDEDVAPLYKTRYWDMLCADSLPAGVDYVLFDFAVNSGVHEASKVLQQIVGAEVDGEIGAHTLYAMSQKHAPEVIAAVSAARLAFLEALPAFEHFGHGWTTRVKAVKEEALTLVV